MNRCGLKSNTSSTLEEDGLKGEDRTRKGDEEKEVLNGELIDKDDDDDANEDDGDDEDDENEEEENEEEKEGEENRGEEYTLLGLANDEDDDNNDDDDGFVGLCGLVKNEEDDDEKDETLEIENSSLNTSATSSHPRNSFSFDVSAARTRWRNNSTL
jgi:hypothetical protein